MMTLDPTDEFCQEDNDSHSRDNDLKNLKDSLLYKDTVALLKQKMCTAQGLLKQFNSKAKEYKDLNLELHQTKLDKEKLFNKYNSASEKLARLELSIKDHEKSCNEYKSTAEKQKLELDEKKKHVEQLEFKMKIMEKDNFRLKDEMKKMQQESKAAKSKKAGKSQACQTSSCQLQDAGVNTDLRKTLPTKPQTRDKDTMTINTSKDPFDFYCSGCKNQIDPPPMGQIFKLMSVPPPQLTNPFSPPSSPRSIPSSCRQSESIASNTLEQYFDSSPNYVDKIEKSRKADEPSFMLIDKLNRKINNLERLVKQKKKKKRQTQDDCCHQACSLSKNIKFIVQLPNEQKYFEYAKQHSRKQKRLKRLNKKQIKNKKISKVAAGWQVEKDAPTKGLNLLKQKYENLASTTETIDLFESPAILEQVNVDSSEAVVVNSPNLELDTGTDKMDIELDDERNPPASVAKRKNPVQEPIVEKAVDSSSENEKDVINIATSNDDSLLTTICSLSDDEDSRQDVEQDKQLAVPSSLVANLQESSDESLHLKCAANVKRGNVIESGDSCEESSDGLDKNVRRKKLLAKRKQLITKIRNLKKTSKKPMISNVKTEKRPESHDDTASPVIPTKKLRVAHKPKDTSEIKTEPILDTSEPHSRAKQTKPVKALLRTTKQLKLMSSVVVEPTEPSSPQLLEAPETSGKELKLMSGVVVEPTEPSSPLLLEAPETSDKEVDSQEASEEVASEAVETAVVTETEENCSTACNDSLDDSKEELVVQQDKMPTRQLRFRNVVMEKPLRKTGARSRAKASNEAGPKSDAVKANDCKKPKKKKTPKATKLPFVKAFNSTNSSLADTPILTHLNNFLLETSKEGQEDNREHLQKNERLVREQLSRLMENEPLEDQVLAQVSQNLLSLDGVALDAVAMILVEYAATEYSDDTICDKTFTPPAPPMTKFEQKLVTLIASINEREPVFVDAVQKGLQYKLFRLGKPTEVHVVERLFRLLVILNKVIKKDREKVRMLISDALYCFNVQAMNIIYITLSCWSEVFPNYASNNDILLKTVVHIIMSANVNRPFSKLMSLKNLLTSYYGYPSSGYRVETFLEELVNNLKENVPGVSTALILLCKSKGAEWTLDNVIPRLKRMVVEQAHPSMYDALTLLGNLLRPLSSDNLRPKLEEITDQLCHVLSDSGGAHDLNEGIVSCLLNIGGKFSFRREKIARCVLQWQPTQDLRPTTKEKFDSFLKTHNAEWWRKFVQQNFPAVE